MAKTQECLATGLKVNSALDNPTNFFTAASLNSRAGDMSNLLDSMSNGIKTIEAADNGLSSITKTVESMQSTLRQARQDKSFKTQSFAVDTGASGQLQFSAGAVGTPAVGVSLGTPMMQSTFAASADFVAPGSQRGGVSFTFEASSQSFTSGLHQVWAPTTDTGAGPVILDNAAVTSAGNHDAVIDSAAEFVDAFNAAVAASAPGIGLTASTDGTNIYLLSDTVGAGSFVGVAGVAHFGGSTSSYGEAGPSYGSVTPSASTSKQITISNGSQTANITLSWPSSRDAGSARSYIQSELAAQGVTGITVGGTGDRIDLTGAANGSNTITVGGPDSAAVFGTSGTQVVGSTGPKTVDELVQSINSTTALAGKVRASNDNGKLRIENLSTEALEVEGVGTDGEIDGTSGSANIGGNEVRKNLVKQFNELRDQLDKLADDASFNGINLLRGDKLKLTFNETGTSTIDIQAKDANGDPTSINNTTLGIVSAVDADFDNDASLDARLGKLGDALGKLRSQASAFGSNLSIVENRNDFTKAMINTLETGAANLTLADTNQEAANLLALQTRQQLSSTALSMASQADQAVLRLF